MQEIMADTIKATVDVLDPNHRQHCFELFGYDFMLDDDCKVYLIEVNTNPCLGVTSSFSSRFISALLDDTLRIAVDPLFPPPDGLGKRLSAEQLPEIRYELVFDGTTEPSAVKTSELDS
jgi:tubulin--tyrosine ligase